MAGMDTAIALPELEMALSGRIVRPPQDRWHIKLAGGALAYDAPLPEQSTEVDAGKMAVTIRISTPRLDRSRDMVVGKGIDTSNHQLNPLALFNHDRWMPVGLAVDPSGNYQVKVGDAETTSTTYFFQGGKNYEHAMACEQVFRLIEMRALNGGSIGFRPKPNKTKVLSDQDGQYFVIEECELLEYSHVYFPDNPETLVVAIQKGIGGRQMAPYLRQSLEPMVAPLLGTKSVTGGWDVSRTKNADQPPEPSPTPKDSEPDETPLVPGGAQFLAALHAMSAEAMEFCERNLPALEPEVAESFGELVTMLASLSDSVSETFTARYPDLPKLAKDDDPKPKDDDPKPDDGDNPDDKGKSLRWRKALAKSLTRWRAARPNASKSMADVVKFLGELATFKGVWSTKHQSRASALRVALQPKDGDLDMAAIGDALAKVQQDLATIAGK